MATAAAAGGAANLAASYAAVQSNLRKQYYGDLVDLRGALLNTMNQAPQRATNLHLKMHLIDSALQMLEEAKPTVSNAEMAGLMNMSAKISRAMDAWRARKPPVRARPQQRRQQQQQTHAPGMHAPAHIAPALPAHIAPAPQPGFMMAPSPFGAPEVQGGASPGGAAARPADDRPPYLPSSDRFDFLSKLIAGPSSDSLAYAPSASRLPDIDWDVPEINPSGNLDALLPSEASEVLHQQQRATARSAAAHRMQRMSSAEVFLSRMSARAEESASGGAGSAGGGGRGEPHHHQQQQQQQPGSLSCYSNGGNSGAPPVSALHDPGSLTYPANVSGGGGGGGDAAQPVGSSNSGAACSWLSGGGVGGMSAGGISAGGMSSASPMADAAQQPQQPFQDVPPVPHPLPPQSMFAAAAAQHAQRSPSPAPAAASFPQQQVAPAAPLVQRDAFGSLMLPQPSQVGGFGSMQLPSLASGGLVESFVQQHQLQSSGGSFGFGNGGSLLQFRGGSGSFGGSMQLPSGQQQQQAAATAAAMAAAQQVAGRLSAMQQFPHAALHAGGAGLQQLMGASQQGAPFQQQQQPQQHLPWPTMVSSGMPPLGFNSAAGGGGGGYGGAPLGAGAGSVGGLTVTTGSQQIRVAPANGAQQQQQQQQQAPLGAMHGTRSHRNTPSPFTGSGTSGEAAGGTETSGDSRGSPGGRSKRKKT